ncbi:MAG: DUF2798 domain-containing protein [Pseudomonadota bacterium]|nr:DUF2798 domain-containing protein [Pseudomonadota bacterium]
MFKLTVATVISTLLLSTIMSGLVSFFITSLNTGDFPPKMAAWMLAWAIATPIVFITAPFSKYVAKKLSDDPRDKE